MRKLKSNKGVALTIVTIFAMMSSMIAGTYMAMSTSDISHSQHQVDSAEALYLAESGLERALFEIITIDEDPMQALPVADFTIDDYNLNDVSPNNINFMGETVIDILVEVDTPGQFYKVTSTATVGGATKTLRAMIRNNPPSTVFDYVYFVNNWGKFIGNSINTWGDIRSNGDFYFEGNPTVHGHVYAVDDIDTNGGEIRGWPSGTAGDPYLHAQSVKVPMPNLQDLSVYEEKATAQNSSIVINGVTIVDGIYGDDVGETDNLVLVGTNANPIEINGPVVIRGDLIIKGFVTGKGTIYTGRNVYIADDILYDDGPSTANPQGTGEASWYQNNKDKDLIAFAARENIIVGDYTDANWGADAFMLNAGDEDIGMDGIPGTQDTYEGDSIFQPEYEDLDEDGIWDDNYTWADIQTGVPVTNFDNLPTGVTAYGDLVGNQIKNLNGVFYTNHCFAANLDAGSHINGALIAKDDALVYNGSLNFDYDLRIHSKYTGKDADWLTNFSPPTVANWGLEQYHE